ncbi:unnamed protein product, partial [Strongylus vulgaris]
FQQGNNSVEQEKTERRLISKTEELQATLAELTESLNASFANGEGLDENAGQLVLRQMTEKINALTEENHNLTAYPSLSVSNFSSDWSDGRAFCALIHNIRPDLVDRTQLSQNGCAELAVKAASKIGVNIELGIFSKPTPDWKHVMAAVFELYKKYESIEDSRL